MLIGDRIKLVPLESKNIPIFLKWMNDQEILQYLAGNNRPLTIEEEQEWFAQIKNKKNAYYFSIIIKENEKLIGNCSFDVDWKNRVGGMGIVIGEKQYQNQGYGTEAIKLVVKHAFEELNLNRMELQVYSNNPRALKCYEKVRFAVEGRKRQFVFIHGEYHDAIIMGLLKEEWEKNK